MKNKYNDNISKIQVSDEFKDNLIQKMQQEEMKKMSKKLTIRKRLSILIGAITTFACGGVAFAVLTGRLNIGEISYSENYIEYEQKIEEQCLESNGAKVKLESVIANEGFLLLNFNIELNEELGKYGFDYLGLNYIEEVQNLRFRK